MAYDLHPSVTTAALRKILEDVEAFDYSIVEMGRIDGDTWWILIYEDEDSGEDVIVNFPADDGGDHGVALDPGIPRWVMDEVANMPKPSVKIGWSR